MHTEKCNYVTENATQLRVAVVEKLFQNKLIVAGAYMTLYMYDVHVH